eukprot:TRINITY_DN68879_c0_g1_i1.p1 TRINITY_DN68879_c0_g1~~TRINITY_DN68879_c0_g1_i1.p1  ORF type:complete len:231 (+),score=34.80 TRINITY_DN68879_c0_g1_i1:200-892(+)
MTTTVCLPGDEVPLSGDIAAGLGVTVDQDSSRAYATAAGLLKHQGDEVSVENLRKRYLPRGGDVVVGIITHRTADAYKVDIRAPSPAYLPSLAFNSATRRNRPNLEVGALVFARVVSAHPDLETELSCVDLETKKAWTTMEVQYGELKGGLNFEVALSAANRLVQADCFILDRLGKDFPYELCAGQNGRLWLQAQTARETVLLLQAIRRSFGMTDPQVEAMVSKMVQVFS